MNPNFNKLLVFRFLVCYITDLLKPITLSQSYRWILRRPLISSSTRCWQPSSSLDLPDAIHNWLINFLHDQGHVTWYRGMLSTLATINASIVPWSGHLASAQ